MFDCGRVDSASVLLCVNLLLDKRCSRLCLLEGPGWEQGRGPSDSEMTQVMGRCCGHGLPFEKAWSHSKQGWMPCRCAELARHAWHGAGWATGTSCGKENGDRVGRWINGLVTQQYFALMKMLTCETHRELWLRLELRWLNTLKWMVYCPTMDTPVQLYKYKFGCSRLSASAWDSEPENCTDNSPYCQSSQPRCG